MLAKSLSVKGGNSASSDRCVGGEEEEDSGFRSSAS